jgi:carbon-monoxide dehydrogenase large subunit
VDAGLEETFYWEPPVAWANATHLALVEVDMASGKIEIDRASWRDCGVVINPMLVDGQIAVVRCRTWRNLFEELVYDGGAPPTGS